VAVSYVAATWPILPWVSAVGSYVTAASENNVTKLWTLCISAPEGEEGECSGLVGVRILNMIGGELGRVGLGDLAVIDDRVLRLGKEAENSGILFRLTFFKIGAVVEIAAALIEALVLLLFGGVSICFFFRLRSLMGMLSSESSVEILSMGVDGSFLLGDGVVCMDVSTGACTSSVTCGGVSSICSVISWGIFSEISSVC